MILILNSHTKCCDTMDLDFWKDVLYKSFDLLIKQYWEEGWRVLVLHIEMHIVDVWYHFEGPRLKCFGLCKLPVVSLLHHFVHAHWLRFHWDCCEMCTEFGLNFGHHFLGHLVGDTIAIQSIMHFRLLQPKLLIIYYFCIEISMFLCCCLVVVE